MKIGKIFLLPLFLIIVSKTSFAQLTGEWTDDNGACYRIRQIDNQIFWSMDGSPRVINVFMGYRAGNTITGTWADIPGGNMMGDGTLSLLIESNDRMVKIDQTGNYGGQIWTRLYGSCGRSECRSPIMSSSPGQNQFLSADEYLVAPNRRHYLIMQRDGNLVVYEGNGPENQGRATWQSNSDETYGDYFLAMQEDGNLVIYKGNKNENFSAEYHIWSSESNLGTGNYFLSINDGGQLEICAGSGPDDNPQVIDPK